MKTWRLLFQNEFTYGELGSMISPAIKRARKEGMIPDTALFNEFKQPSVLYCYYIDPEKEIDLKYCEKNQISFQRVLSAGGTGVSDTGQIVLSLYFDSLEYPLPADTQSIMRILLSAIAEAFSAEFDIECKFRPLNDITIGPKKFTLCTCHLDGSTVQFRLAIQVKPFSLDINKIIHPPSEKFADKEGKSVSEVVTSIEGATGKPISFSKVQEVLLGSLKQRLDIEFHRGEITPQETEYIKRAKESYGSESFKFARTERIKFGPVPSGMVRSEYRTKIPQGPMISIVVLTQAGKIKNILINGSLQVSPLEVIEHLENTLLETEVREESIRRKVEEVFQIPHAEFPGLTPENFSRIILSVCSGG